MDKFYITTSIPYVNGAPHIGFALELVQADVLARFNNLLHKKTFFLTGADEHGQKIFQTAQKKNLTPQELADKNSAKFKQLSKDLNISNNNFIRTSDKQNHWPGAQKVWEKLAQKGDIYKGKYKGLYCVGCEAYLTKKDLVDGKCPEHQCVPEKISEENYFFKLSKYLPEIKKLIADDVIKIIPQKRKNEILSLIDHGMGDVSFSRPSSVVSWGIPVPGDKTQTMYVWCDALTNYLSGIGFPSKNYKAFWPPNVQCIGKGVLRFHAGIWLGMLLSLGFDLPQTILVHGYVTASGQKMSKSLGNVINPFDLIEKYGADALRYFLLREIPPTSDGDFTWEKFDNRYKADLANDLGNLINRSRKIIAQVRPSGHPDKKFAQQVNQAIKDFDFCLGLKIIWKKIAWANQFIDKERLWNSQDKQKLTLLSTAIDQIGQTLQVFLPDSAEKILQNKPGVLFPKIEK